jgi:hypothetical protein
MSPALLAFAAMILSGPGIDPASYRLVSVREFEAQALSEHPNILSRIDGKDSAVFHPVEKLRFGAVFTGRMRSLSGFKGQTLQSWVRVNMKPLAGDGGVQREVEVREGDHAFWLPIQEVLWPHFQGEVLTGARVGLHVIFLGAADEQFLYLMTEFRAFDQVPLKPIPVKPD